MKTTKKGELFVSFFPFNYYSKFIGLPTYKQGRKLGLNVFLSLLFCPTFFILFLCIPNLLSYDFKGIIINLLTLNTLYAGLMYYRHFIYKQRRDIIMYSRFIYRNLKDVQRRIKFDNAQLLDENKHLKNLSDKMDDEIEKLNFNNKF